jgi:ketosteroid isomerase-like protein
MSFDNLPRPIAAFLQAAGKRDTFALLATFADDAVLVDKGVEHRGDAIREWNDRSLLKGGAAVQPINVARRDGKTALTVLISGHDGDKPAQFDWWFKMVDGKISALTIVPTKSPDLPAPVASFVLAANTFDLEALLDAFADDAVVNDQLREYRGKSSIKEWAARDIVGERVTMYIVSAVEHYGHAIVTANVDGDYDKRGLPDPLGLAFYFSIHRDKIIQLIILRNEPDV